MSSTFVVKNSERKFKRDLNKILDDDLRKYLTEVITNSDDSYKRIESTEDIQDKVPKPIYLEIDKTKKEVLIIDNAEGMDEKSLKDNFSVYGDDKSRASEKIRVRGLFGQGASDVLFNAADKTKKSEIKTIKNNQACICKFFVKDGQREGNIVTANKHLKDLRERFNIPQNGTIVYFGIPPKVAIPNDIINKIKNFYMLRFILNDPNRKVLLKTKTKNRKALENELIYQFPTETKSLVEQKISFNYENTEITGLLKLSYIENKDENRYGELKILVFDNDKAVYDNTFFEFGNNHPGTEKLFGSLELFGSSEIIRKKLNQKDPEEILTDTRDGFNKKHEFYKLLNKQIEPLIGKALKIINVDRKQSVVSFNNDQRLKNLLKELNNYFKEEIGEETEIGGVDKGINPPASGLEFIFPKINITLEKKYTIKLLINTSLVKIGSTLEFDLNENKEISVNIEKVKVTNDDIIFNNLAVKSISIKGNEVTEQDVQILVKSNNGYECKLFVAVIDKEIHYPKYGLEFWPDKILTKPEFESKIHLYFDINKFALGSEIKFKSTNEKILIDKESIILNDKNMINENIGVIENIIFGSENEIEGEIIASAKNYSTNIKVYIKNSFSDKVGNNGYFSGFDYDSETKPMWYQTYFDKNGIVWIMLNNYINKEQLGQIINGRPNLNQEKYIIELCSIQCSKQLIVKKIEKGHINSDDFESVYDELQKQKDKIFNLMYKIYFNKSDNQNLI